MKRIFGLLLIVSSLFFLSGCGVITFSDGDRTGKVVKFSNKGILVKTWEGQMALTDVRTFNFTVRDTALVEKIKTASKAGKKVTLTYEQKLGKWFWQGDTTYWITAVE